MPPARAGAPGPARTSPGETGRAGVLSPRGRLAHPGGHAFGHPRRFRAAGPIPRGGEQREREETGGPVRRERVLRPAGGRVSSRVQASRSSPPGATAPRSKTSSTTSRGSAPRTTRSSRSGTRSTSSASCSTARGSCATRPARASATPPPWSRPPSARGATTSTPAARRRGSAPPSTTGVSGSPNAACCWRRPRPTCRPPPRSLRASRSRTRRESTRSRSSRCSRATPPTARRRPSTDS